MSQNCKMVYLKTTLNLISNNFTNPFRKLSPLKYTQKSPNNLQNIPKYRIM